MTIHYYGVGFSMYAVKNSACKAVEGEGHHHFVMYNVTSIPACSKHLHVSNILFFATSKTEG